MHFPYAIPIPAAKRLLLLRALVLLPLLLIAACRLLPKTPTPTAAAPPTETPEPTTAPKPTATLTVITGTLNAAGNVRSGPGTDYPVTGALNAGDKIILTGKSVDSHWWRFSMPAAGDQTAPANATPAPTSGWIAGFLVDVTADAAAIPFVESPSTPAAPSPTPTP